MKVLKFGGTSVANAKNIGLVLNIVNNKSKGDKIIVVVSAFSKVTDLLHAAALNAVANNLNYKEILLEIETKHFEALKELIPINEHSGLLSHLKRNLNQLETLLEGCFLLGELTNRTLDTILSFGELLSSFVIFEAFKKIAEKVGYLDSRTVIKTNDNYGNAAVNFELTNSLLNKHLELDINQIVIMPGFISSSEKGYPTTLGRGGSDYTAAIIAGALEATVLEIWTDVNGMYTANPKIVKQAQPISFISYQEAMELSHFGAKVLYPPTIQPVLRKKIPILIKNTFEPESEGTYISNENNNHNGLVKGISHIENVSLLTLEGSGMIGVTGSSKRFFEALSVHKINVIFITQASSEHSICIGIKDIEAEKAEKAINDTFEIEINQNKIEPCFVEKDMCIIALVGEKMKNHQGLSGRMFSTLGKNNVNIRAIAQGASERNISAVINKIDVKKALNTLHENFFEEYSKQLNLFVMGIGNVGAKFMEQVQQQENYLRESLKINLRVIGLANSRKMYFEEEGIPLKNWKSLIEAGEKSDKNNFIDKVKELNFRNSIFVDITADAGVSGLYDRFLQQNVAVVTCNKIACSSSYPNYSYLKSLSRKYNTPFLFETNVGAGLPIIDTVKNLVVSGDRIHKIQAVLSGSLNFIFNHFDENNSFESVVKEAGKQGFTEPDPKIDLSGIDVARKILILIRESNYEMEIEEIENQSFMPVACLETKTNEAFFESLRNHAAHFEALLENAKAKYSRLKYVAQFENGKAKVGLEFIPKEHPFYNLEGKDNIVLFYTDRYIEQPLIIKGAGAGASVTASGIFADVIRIRNF